jgi:hypothetical protein
MRYQRRMEQNVHTSRLGMKMFPENFNKYFHKSAEPHAQKLKVLVVCDPLRPRRSRARALNYHLTIESAEDMHTTARGEAVMSTLFP